MGKEVIYNSEKMSLWYHDNTKIIHHQFHAFTYGGELRDVLLKGLEVMKNKGSVKWLADDRKNPVMKQDDMKWTASVWRPAVIDAGWKYWAIVLPEKAAGKMAIQKIVKEYAETGVTVQVFTESGQALQWLENQ